MELGILIPSPPISPAVTPEEEEAGGYLPSSESLTLDDENQKADDDHEGGEANDNSKFSGAKEEPRAKSPSQTENSENLENNLTLSKSV